ncbi:unnamed protein product, partial [Ectocarpus sp. 12 AP-2014]
MFFIHTLIHCTTEKRRKTCCLGNQWPNYLKETRNTCFPSQESHNRLRNKRTIPAREVQPARLGQITSSHSSVRGNARAVPSYRIRVGGTNQKQSTRIDIPTSRGPPGYSDMCRTIDARCPELCMCRCRMPHDTGILDGLLRPLAFPMNLRLSHASTIILIDEHVAPLTRLQCWEVTVVKKRAHVW